MISGFVLGGILGWCLQRGGFCMNTAVRSIVFREDRSILQAWILILVINIPAITLLENLGLLYPARAPFTPFSLAIGGLLFGAGMVWAGGCVSGTYYRAAKGMLGSLLALLGFAAGATAMSVGSLAPLREFLNVYEWTVSGEIPTAGHLIPANPWLGRWIVTVLLTGGGILFLTRSGKSKFSVGWKWPLTGITVGLLALGAWIFSSLEGRNYGLSLVQPTVALNSWFLSGEGEGLNWTAWMLLALPVGAFFAAWKGRDLRLRMPKPQRALLQFFGGLAMGSGASLAGGCNIGHGITGLSALALSSVSATVFTMAGNWMATALVWRTERKTQSQ